jgi:transposase, IS5 family
MYNHDNRQKGFVNFLLPFDGKLQKENRWVKLAEMIPWEKMEPLYSKQFSKNGMGAPAKSFRMALGALIIKERLGTTDEETVEQIKENPYLQYFLGLEEFQNECPFDSSLYVHFRKRIEMPTMAEINEHIFKASTESQKPKKQESQNSNDDESPPPNKSNQGQLIVDATCAPVDITYPTDLKLLNEAREKTEDIIDTLHKSRKGQQKKPRDHRRKARKEYLKAAKNKNLTHSKRRNAVGKQLRYVGRNLRIITQLSKEVGLHHLSKKHYRDLLVINELYRQQKEMFDHNVNSIEDRIVSISQPHVRPIVRGKLAAKTEFGAKISVSLHDGYVFLDHLSWNNFNESGDLCDQIEKYKIRLGFYPKSVHADKIYRTKENRKYCKERGIRLSGPPLGRPKKTNTESASDISNSKRIQKEDEIDRIAIEGKFGQAKRRFGLGRVMTKLKSTSQSAIALTFLVINLEKWLKLLYFLLFSYFSILKNKDKDLNQLQKSQIKQSYFEYLLHDKLQMVYL